MKVSILLLFSTILLVSCGGNKNEAAYAELLAQPPYAAITDSIGREPDRDDLYFRRAVLLNRNNLPEPALADFRKAWSINAEEPYAIGVGNILLEKRPDSATAFLQQAIRDLPQSIFLRILLARSYDAQKETDKAILVCEEILHTDPNQLNTLALKAELLEKKNDAPGTIAALEKVHQLVPSNIQLANKLMYQYAETKNPKALTLADTMLLRDSMKVSADPLYVKGLYYVNTGDNANALRFFDQTIQRSHRYLNAYIEKGKIFFNQKKIPEALKTFQLAITVDAAFADAWYWIGRCQELQGQKADAKLSYEKAFSLDKTFVEAKEAMEKVR
ncbi:tetratricopeptide repeat protein [Terrimonas sp. NA20]|uniref:Tetratricopeptide repeat protein n=1 Tax=Terrimonas ginsenosidimutans TaxID=2908004 RepID=A0ABS9KZF5_9BACT|nr:tetratricopeptide repeat protein [Terrimonas ginsenosidimutans]MCG2617686.1 tetratricopeptide repeat protein [Terrimonas ginsenosidimutans]